MADLYIEHYYSGIRPDLDAMVLKYALDALVTSGAVHGVTNDNQLEWGFTNPITFVKRAYMPGGATYIWIDSGGMLEFPLLAPLPTMNHMLKLSRYDGGLKRIRDRCYGLVQLSLDNLELVRQVEFKVSVLRDLVKKAPAYYPGYKNPMGVLAFLERYHKSALGHKGLPRDLKKALTSEGIIKTKTKGTK